jgi:hypothetical protein
MSIRRIDQHVVVPTILFRLVYELPVLQPSRRELLWLGVTAHPGAEWVAHQITELLAGASQHDMSFVIARIATLSFDGSERWGTESSDLSSVLLARLFGSIRRDCLNHVIVFGARHLRHLLQRSPHPANRSRKTRADSATSRGAGARTDLANLGRTYITNIPVLNFRQGQ